MPKPQNWTVCELPKSPKTVALKHLEMGAFFMFVDSDLVSPDPQADIYQKLDDGTSDYFALSLGRLVRGNNRCNRAVYKLHLDIQYTKI